jgi:uncharacterized protein (DUF433 family)
MILPDYLAQDSDGFIRITGHRVGLHHLVHFYNEGYSPEMLADQFPTLPLPIVHKVIAYYLETRAEVDAPSARVQDDVLHQAQSAPGTDLAELRRRFEALRSAEAS